MKDELIRKVQKLQIQEGDVVALTLKDDVNEDTLEDLHDVLSEFSLDTGTFVLVFREGVFSDIRRLDLTALLSLNQLVEEALTKFASQESAGDC